MSYQFEMCFKQVKDKTEVFDIVMNARDLMWEKRREILKANRGYIPSLHHSKANEVSDNYWLYLVMQMGVTYWKKYGIIGITGAGIDAIGDTFGTLVLFGNSTDCDYDFDAWGSEINLFNDIKDRIFNYTSEQVTEELHSADQDYVSLEQVQNDIWFYKRALMYDCVFNALKLDKWVYDKEDPNSNFVKFAVSLLDSQHKYVDCIDILEKVRDKA